MLVVSGIFFFFFFKQKTAYEMRISDWSSDVCSSDLLARLAGGQGGGDAKGEWLGAVRDRADVLFPHCSGRRAGICAHGAGRRRGHDGVESAVQRLPFRKIYPRTA